MASNSASENREGNAGALNAPARNLQKKLLIAGVGVLVAGFLIPERTVIPVAGASSRDWNAKSFWFAPWGKSGVHKGIDIFAPIGRSVLSTTDGVVIFRGELALGGNVVAVLGPKWRVHYFAHLNSVDAALFEPVWSGEPIGTVGNSGNAIGKPPHLHYAIVRMLPAPWAADRSSQGYKKAFFIDPNNYLRQ